MVLSVTVIVCTMAEPERRALLLRALDSARAASAQPVQFAVVVNGPRRDPEVVQALQAMADVMLVSLPHASLPAACLAGRQAVKTPFYCFLDDDDELLPGAVDLRLVPLLADPAVDLVTSNGYEVINGCDVLNYSRLGRVAAAPWHEIFQENWLASCSAMFRTASVGSDYFEDSMPYAEWTWLAFQLAQKGKTVAVVDQPTFRVHNTPGSASKSQRHGQALATLHQKMLDSAPPPDIERLVRQRIGAHLHTQAEKLWRSGQLRAAWAAHLRSLASPGGLRYLLFSRHLLLPGRTGPAAQDAQR